MTGSEGSTRDRHPLVDVALEYAAAGWPVFTLGRTKVPAFANPHPDGSRERSTCHGECGQFGHGLYDGSTDPARVAEMFTLRPRANIAARVPDGLLVVDVDPRSGGDTHLAELEAEHWPLPATLTVESGRRDGGGHRYYLDPGGRLTASRFLRTGIDLKFAGRGYAVLPPSIHAATGEPYRWTVTMPPAPLPSWFVAMLRPAPPKRAPRYVPQRYNGDSPADWFCARYGWADVLERFAPRAWSLVGGNGEDDGSQWRHPDATSAVSATVRNGCLFAYSQNTPLPVTEPGASAGLTKFRAWALLTGRSLSDAAREAVSMRTREVSAA